ncbi:MAG: polysaccharide deacetylase family protein [Actinobacteria bacterium]|nr:polysaccharide deacetylase family protein [Actinomycetota bacterium]
MSPPRPPLALAYHGVAAVRLRDDTYSLFTRPATLRRQIQVLRRWGYRFTTFGDLAARVQRGEGDGYAALTFDDGMADNHSTLLPVLRDEGVPATVFVATAYIGGRHPDVPEVPMLEAADVVALRDGGVEIGSHSHAHRDLTTLSFDEVLADLRRSRRALADVLGEEPTVLAYPFGRASEETRRAAREAGFAFAARAEAQGNWDDPWDQPRQDMHSYSGRLGLWLKRDNRYEPIMRVPFGRIARSGGRRLKRLVR